MIRQKIHGQKWAIIDLLLSRNVRLLVFLSFGDIYDRPLWIFSSDCPVESIYFDLWWPFFDLSVFFISREEHFSSEWDWDWLTDFEDLRFVESRLVWFRDREPEMFWNYACTNIARCGSGHVFFPSRDHFIITWPESSRVDVDLQSN